MTRTTPPRPHDVAKQFPALAQYAKPAVRLHPRRGEPGVGDSSIGGPLLWPADEPWPTCELAHDDFQDETLDYTFAMRAYLADRDRREERGEALDWDAERRRMAALEAEYDVAEYPEYEADAPPPLIPLAQLHYRDVPGLPWADRFDLLQLLWCPRDHPDADTPYNPAFQLRWRRAESINERLTEPPRPVVGNGDYVPNPCVVHPEVVTEYPVYRELPETLQQAVAHWAEAIDDESAYLLDASVAPGWKAVGHGGNWAIIDPYPMTCECGELQLPLFTVDSGESGGDSRSWDAVEDTDGRYSNPVEIIIGRAYILQLYYCPAFEQHVNRTEMF
ncbi:hypothetical protein [Glycomyces algeriensis]|uniref:DUF1963 domain-containing protein n=1 Tax=Glycomyces algeriensis TaxID=256037 RepID=A0A9W6G531_9ACTN|nr:hypothetical protein [Glycomyces algeriensis]MDA1367737.1 hypothetical protein [Glycomyces algeriensis]MDR7352899.1 hypothetical protein [Glycomyces algeriensis]GLI40586.1 hypothetical protein GALLR39Z86_04360 [Glycomyces algeriensis]